MGNRVPYASSDSSNSVVTDPDLLQFAGGIEAHAASSVSTEFENVTSKARSGKDFGNGEVAKDVGNLVPERSKSKRSDARGCRFGVVDNLLLLRIKNIFIFIGIFSCLKDRLIIIIITLLPIFLGVFDDSLRDKLIVAVILLSTILFCKCRVQTPTFRE